MSLFQFVVVSAFAGSSSPTSASFESIATNTLQGVQSAQVSIVYPRQDALYWDGGGNQELVDRPRADLALNWLWTSGATNELSLGFTTSPSGTISALSALNDERNYYLLINQDGRDSIGYTAADCRVLALGNGVVSEYAFNAAVGQPTTVSATVQGLNLLLQPSGTNQPLPAVWKQSGTAVTGQYTLPTAGATITDYWQAQPGSISLSFDTGCALGVALSGHNACPVESFGFSIALPRGDVKDLGWAYPNNRPIIWPATVSIHANARVNAFQLDALNRYGCPDSGQSFTVGFKNTCTALDDLQMQFNGAKLDSESLGVEVGGGSAQVSFNWTLKVNDLNRTSAQDPGFYINQPAAIYTAVVFPQVEYTSGNAPLTFNLSSPCFLAVLSGPGILSGNNVLVTDEVATVVVRCAGTNGTDSSDLTVTVG